MAQSILYLDFDRYSEIDKNNDYDRLYKVGLKDQFVKLQLGNDYNWFVTKSISRKNGKAWISYPNFDRSDPSDTKNKWFNIAVRLEIPKLPNDLVLMCDLNEYTPKNKSMLRSLVVKGFTTLDKECEPCGEIAIECDMMTKVDQSWYLDGNSLGIYLSEEQIIASVLSTSFLKNLNKQYVVKHPEDVIKTLDDWQLYLDSRTEIMETDYERCYSIDESPEIFMGYYKSNCSEDERGKAIPYLKVKGDMDVWSRTELPGSESAPIIHIVHDFLRKEYESDQDLKKKFDIFTGDRSLIVSEKVIIERKERNGKTEINPKYGSNIKLQDSRISSKAGEEIIYNQKKIDSLMMDAEREIASVTKESENNLEKEVKKRHSEFIADRLVQIKKNLTAEKRQEYLQMVTEERDKTIAEEKASIQKRLKTTESELDECLKEDKRKDLNKKKRSDNVKRTEQLEKEKAKLNSLLQTVEDRYVLEDMLTKKVEPAVNEIARKISAKEENDIKSALAPQYKEKRDARIGEITNSYNERIEIVKRDETRVRLHLFYRLDTEGSEDNNQILNTCSSKLSGRNLFLYKDPSGDRAIIARQSRALSNLRRGFVMNPFLATSLFNITKQQSRNLVKVPHFFSSRLNAKQKEAIESALSSNGLFLIRGPPGTGKTEVIAEITAQLVSRDKKVLIASENHKAVDNAFERLPELPTLRRVRLFGEQSKKERKNRYSVQQLTRNFYSDIAKSLEDEIKRTVSSKEYSGKLDNIIQDLKKKLREIGSLKEEASDVLEEIEKTEVELSRIRKKLIRSQNEDADLKAEIIEIQALIKEIEAVATEPFDRETEVLDVEVEERVLNQEMIRELHQMKRPNIRAEYCVMSEHPVFFDMLRKRNLTNVETERNDLEYRMMEYRRSNSFNPNDLRIFRIFNGHIPDIEAVMDAKDEIQEFVDSVISNYEDDIKKKERLCNDQSHLESQIERMELHLQALMEDGGVKAYRDAELDLHSRIQNVLRDNNISEHFDTLEEGISYIDEEKERIKSTSVSGLSEPLMLAYKSMATYLRDESVVVRDQNKLNSELLDYANVIGLTCTTRENISTDVGEVDLRRANIDVVIVDEVSKVSFLEVLYPILYGKTIILVGDDKQLPPVYQNDIDDNDMGRYDIRLVNPDLERKFKKMYQTSFFKELYERSPNSNKTMLTIQYRMHPQIMRADNIFYDDALTYGGADGNREHHLTIKGAGNRTIISKDKHLLFINVNGQEDRGFSGGKSYINRDEVNLIVNLLKRIDSECVKDRFGNDIRGKKFTQADDTRLSMGVICGYRDQAKFIKNKLKGTRFQSFNKTDDEQFMVDTVDNFQGDERDIIILSLVRSKPDKSFMKVYNRINVAISRARCLLIIVGNSKAFGSLKIDLDGKTDYVYQKIVNVAKDCHGYFQYEDLMGE